MTTDFWDGRTVMVAAGGGCLGSHLVENLERRSDSVDVFVARSEEYYHRERADIRRAFIHSGTDVVIHLAATVGGIGANQRNPGTYFYDNAVMGIELLKIARQFDLEKMTFLGTICAYPEDTPVPFSEGNLFAGYPEPSKAPYGIAKKSLLTQSNAYRREYDFKGI